MAQNYLGIDLGTTETTVSVIEIDDIFDEPLDKLRTLNIHQYDETHTKVLDKQGLASSLYIDRDKEKVYTGKYAQTIYASGNKPLHTIRSVKTRIGGESIIQVPLNDDPQNLLNVDMTELSALLLKTVKESVDKQVKDDLTNVTITIPAGFNSDERSATLTAAKLAGFDNVNLLDEPTAVLLNYLNTCLNSGSDDGQAIDALYFDNARHVLVYDIGGGTLDISIAKVAGDDDGDFDVEILGRSKRMDFGGDDLDKIIASYFLYEFEKINPSIDTRQLAEQAKIVSRIVSNAEKSKIAFNNNLVRAGDNPRRRQRVKETVNFEIIDKLNVTDLSITDELLKQIFASTISEAGELLSPLKKAIRHSKLDVTDIDLVILTGGSGKFYLVEELIKDFFSGNTIIIDFTETNAVSKGAAIHSYNTKEDGDLKKINVSDLMSDSIFIKNGDSFDKLIPQDQAPDSKGKYNYHFRESSHHLEAFLYYGESQEKPWELTEIAGVFKELEQLYKKGEVISLDWHFTQDKILKLSYQGQELVSTAQREMKPSELLHSFTINP